MGLLGFVVAGAAAATVAAVGVSVLCPAAAPFVMMKAPGSPGLLISRLAFEANPKLYFFLLRSAGPAAAVAAFAAAPAAAVAAFVAGPAAAVAAFAA